MFLKIIEKFKKLINERTSPESDVSDGQVKKFKKNNRQNNVSQDFINRKEQSLKDSQGIDDFSGSGYKPPGNVDHEKTNSNMSQRNF